MSRLAAWYRHPDQELLRREMQWTLRWMTRPLPILWILLYCLLHLSIVRAMLRLGTDGALAPVWQMLAMLMPLACVNLALRMRLLRRRTFGMFSKGMPAQLWLSRLQPSNLWPTLLAGPILFALLMAALDFAFASWLAVYAMHHWVDTDQTTSLFMLPASQAGPTYVAVTFGPFEPPSLGRHLIALVVYSMRIVPRVAAMLFVAWRSIPRRPSYAELFVWHLGVYGLCFCPTPLIWLATRAGIGYPLLGQPLLQASAWTAAAQLLASLGIAAGLCVLAWRGLRQPRAWELMRAEAEGNP